MVKCAFVASHSASNKLWWIAIRIRAPRAWNAFAAEHIYTVARKYIDLAGIYRMPPASPAGAVRASWHYGNERQQQFPEMYFSEEASGSEAASEKYISGNSGVIACLQILLIVPTRKHIDAGHSQCIFMNLEPENCAWWKQNDFSIIAKEKNVENEMKFLLENARAKKKRLSMLFQPCRFCLLLVTLKMSCSVSMNEIHDDDYNDKKRETWYGCTSLEQRRETLLLL